MPGIFQKSPEENTPNGGGASDPSNDPGLPKSSGSNRGFWILGAAFVIAVIIYRIFK